MAIAVRTDCADLPRPNRTPSRLWRIACQVGYFCDVEELWSSANYEPRALSLLFAAAPAALLIVVAYAAVLRGAPALRGFLLAHCLCLLPYASAVMLAPSVRSPAVAEQLYRIAAGFIPLAAATGTGLQLSLVGRYHHYRIAIWIAIASALVWLVASTFTNATISDVRWLGSLWFPVAGQWAGLALAHTLVLAVGGFAALARSAWLTPPSDERRQHRAALTANAITYSGLTDVALAYGIGVFPVGWLLSSIGSLLVVRAIVVEDLLRVRAIDLTAPLLVVHLIGGVVLGAIVLSQLGPAAPWPIQVIALAVSFAGVRMIIATVALINRGARGGEGPLERLLAQFVTRSRTLHKAPRIAELAIDIVELAVGERPRVIIASTSDWGWTDEAGHGLPDDRVPDPLVVGWLAEQPTLTLLAVDQLEHVPEDLVPALRALHEQWSARALVVVRSGDDVLALIALPHRGGARRRAPLRQAAFVERLGERLGEALVHARMAEHAATRAALAREVELAATVQSELLPSRKPYVHGDVTVVGSWTPATRCAGDFWTTSTLADQRVVIAIGDVTGHGVASAMVTAAVAGACEVCLRRDRANFDLGALIFTLDHAVRRAGGGELAMTFFAAILDAANQELQFVSCGHPVPYICRPAGTDDRVELHALVGRGNLLGGATSFVAPKVIARPLVPGDVVVCYTDGVVEALDPAGKPFGDRRLQQLLRKLDRAKLAPTTVHDLILAAVGAHRAGRPLDDDETLVIATTGAR